MSTPTASFSRTPYRLAVGLAAIFLGIALWLGLPQQAARHLFKQSVESVVSSDYSRFRSVKVGWTEAQVRQRLGAPHSEYDAHTAPPDWHVPGHARPARPITGRVLIYLGDEPIAYVFISPSGLVEEVVVHGS